MKLSEQQSQMLIGAETIIEMDKCAADALEEIVCYLTDHKDIPARHGMALSRIVLRAFEKRQTLRRDYTT